MPEKNVRPPAPTPITPADRQRLAVENAENDARVAEWARKKREEDIAAGIAPPPLVTSIADSIKKKLEGGEIHTTAEREAEEERLLNGGGQ